MSTTIVLKAEPREATGKGPARQLRRAGKIPAIIYGGTDAPAKIAVDFKEVKHQLGLNPRFFSTIIELDLGTSTARVLAREAQVHPVTDVPVHVDFLRAERGAKVEVPVAVHFVNEEEAPGLRAGGVLNIVRHEIDLVCPADAIPEHLTVDLKGYEIGDSIHISAISLPSGVELTITDRDFTIASIVPPTVAPVEEEEEAEASDTEAETVSEGENDASED